MKGKNMTGTEISDFIKKSFFLAVCFMVFLLLFYTFTLSVKHKNVSSAKYIATTNFVAIIEMRPSGSCATINGEIFIKNNNQENGIILFGSKGNILKIKNHQLFDRNEEYFWLESTPEITTFYPDNNFWKTKCTIMVLQ